MNAVLTLADVGVNYGAVQALASIHLRVAAGERLALVGSNGSGKSTLLRVLHGLVKPSTGAVLQDAKLRAAMLFQRPYMLRTTALNNVAMGLWIRGAAWGKAKDEALRALARVGLQAQAHRGARALSGGQQQRLALARAWSLNPDLLFLDEPTSSLDPHAKREVEALLAGLAERGLTLVFASHNLGQVKRLATRVVYLERGRILADLAVDDFFNGATLAQTSNEAELFLKGELG